MKTEQTSSKAAIAQPVAEAARVAIQAMITAEAERQKCETQTRQTHLEATNIQLELHRQK